jgi:hypothetical protein
MMQEFGVDIIAFLEAEKYRDRHTVTTFRKLEVLSPKY